MLRLAMMETLEVAEYAKVSEAREAERTGRTEALANSAADEYQVELRAR
jgi:hypothetical protein